MQASGRRSIAELAMQQNDSSHGRLLAAALVTNLSSVQEMQHFPSLQCSSMISPQRACSLLHGAWGQAGLIDHACTWLASSMLWMPCST